SFGQLDQRRIYDVQPARFSWPSIGVSSRDQRDRSCQADEKQENGNDEQRGRNPAPPSCCPPEPCNQEKEDDVPDKIGPGHLQGRWCEMASGNRIDHVQTRAIPE